MIIKTVSLVLVASAVGGFFFYKQQVAKKMTYVPTGYKEIPVLQDYY